MKILVVEPTKRPYEKDIQGSLKEMQELVGGTIEAVYPFEDSVALVCNDEAKLIGLPPNRMLRDDSGKPYDILCGTFFVVGLGRENFKSLTTQQLRHYTDLYTREMIFPVPRNKGKEPKNHER
jgi:hypothetical protein